jgi:tRNA(Ile)-lysidine synthase
MNALCSLETSPYVVSKPVHVHRRQRFFSPESLAEILLGIPSTSRFLLAYSGGCDSHALVHAAAQLQGQSYPWLFHALHVDHGLQASSAEWARHCQSVCAKLGVELTLLRTDARACAGESPEAAARAARYRAFENMMKTGDCLITAHHQDDQAETLLLQLLRGGGPHGLAAMPEVSVFASGLHARPLLAYSRRQLREYAQQQSLQWIEDPSNVDIGFDRNYLRVNVVPVLKERWPAFARVLARGAYHQAEAAQLLDIMADEDLQCCIEKDQALRIRDLSELVEERQRNVLRYWLKTLGYKLPDTARLTQIQFEVLHAAPDRCPEVSWEGVVVRRYRDCLYALKPQAAVDIDTVLPWDISRLLPLPDGGSISANLTYGRGIKHSLCQQRDMTGRYRRGGEQCQIAPYGSTRPLKKLLQENGVPPWEREHIPLVFAGEQLAAVADYWVCAPFQADSDEEGISFAWQRTVRG